MTIKVTYEGGPAFEIDHPDEFISRIPPSEDASRYRIDKKDLARWQRKQRIAGVRAQAKRRLMALVDARDGEHLAIILSNQQRQEIRLLRKAEANWTDGEKKEAAKLQALDEAIEDIRNASNKLEKKPPVRFADDKYWPALPVTK